MSADQLRTPDNWRSTHDAAGWQQWAGRHNNNPPVFDPGGDDDDDDDGSGPWQD
jgi:hypothetical protein